MHVKLVDRFELHASLSEHVLLDKSSGAKRLMDSEQYEFIKLLDGSRNLREILELFDTDSGAIVQDFLLSLRQLGAVEDVHRGSLRIFPAGPVPDVRLNAVHLEAFGRCNMLCAHCYQGDLYRNDDGLSWERLERLATEMTDLQVDNVAFSGGEPFLNPLTLEAAKLFERVGLRVNAFFTNGLCLDDQIIEAVRALKSKPTIFLSLDAIEPAGMLFRGFTGAAAQTALDSILRNLHRLLESGVAVVVNTVMTRENFHTLPAMYEMLSDLSIKSWRIGFPKQTGFFQTQSAAHELTWDTMANGAIKILRRHLTVGRPIHLQIEYLYREELIQNLRPLSDDAFVCDYEGKRESCCIKPNGDVVACAYCVDWAIGNINKTPLADIWYSPEMVRLKNIRIRDIPECRDCPIRSLCATGCRANAAFLGGSYERSKDLYACQAVEFFIRHVLKLLAEFGMNANQSIAHLLNP